MFRLFFGSAADRYTHWPLNVNTIRIIEDRSNLRKQVQAITKFDESITLINPPRIPANSDDGSIMLNIIKTSMGHQNKYHEYVNDTFKCFMNNKKHIRLNVESLVDWIKDQVFLDLIIPIRHELNMYEYSSDISCWIDVDNNQNIMNPDLFKLFRNVKTMEIEARFYPFSLVNISCLY